MSATKRSGRETSPSEDLISFARGYLQEDNLSWQEIAGEGSGRLFYRVTAKDGSWVIMVHEHPPTNQRGVTENDSFLYIARHLRGKGLPVPEIYHHDMTRGWFIMEDLGDCHLQTEVMGMKGDRGRLIKTYHRIIDILIRVQVEGGKGFDLARTHNVPYDQRFMLAWESGYFHYIFLNGYLGLDIPDEELREEFEALALRAAGAPGNHFLYRDFQSRNIMVRDNELGLVDFQGGRLGPLQYDLASLLLDPYVELDEEMQDELLEYYLGHIQERIPIDPREFRTLYPFVAIHRAMQVLGAFAFLTKAKGLCFFQSYIPPALRGLRTLLGDTCFDPYKKLRRVVFEEIKGI
ncbi:MAG: phosphotransferase [Deltaproteobacteria bacterium]|nr:phosphotransferase [Deltaproteobacteria bacterium]